jgi:hypothetical protein
VGGLQARGRETSRSGNRLCPEVYKIFILFDDGRMVLKDEYPLTVDEKFTSQTSKVFFVSKINI